jgi:hypothetical protein
VLEESAQIEWMKKEQQQEWAVTDEEKEAVGLNEVSVVEERVSELQLFSSESSHSPKS